MKPIIKIRIYYIPCTVLPDVKFDRRYWIFIGSAVFFSLVSSASTLYLASREAHFMECNSISAAFFAAIGIIPSMVLGNLVLIGIMIAIPYLFRQNEKVGHLSIFIMGLIVLYTALDAVNDVSVIVGFSKTYWVTHRILSSTNNVTGKLVGTGESLC
jgi:hypothetical protein